MLAPRSLKDVDQHGWIIVRIASFLPSLYLALIAVLAPDTPCDEDDEPYSGAVGSGAINVSTRTSEQPLLAAQPSTDKSPPRSAEMTASFASKLTFSYMTPLLSEGRRRALEHNDLFDLLQGDASHTNEHALARSLAKGGSFIRCWHRTYGSYFWATGALQIINTTCTCTNPLLLQWIVTWINEPDHDKKPFSTSVAVMLACSYLIVNSIKSLVLGQYFWRGFRLGLRSRAAIGQVVYAKALSLAHEGRQEFGVGAIVSYMQIDAQKVADALPYLHLTWSGPLQLVVAMILLCRREVLGPIPGLVGLAIMIVSMPITSWVSKKTMTFTRRTMAARDKRVKFTNEVLQGIKILKLFAWEPELLAQLDEKRNAELVAVRDNMLINGMMGFMFTILPLLVTATSFIVYAALGHQLTAAKVFTSLSLFQVLRFPLLVFPMMITRLMDILVVNGRLTKFLNAAGRNVQPLDNDSSYDAYAPRAGGNADSVIPGHFVDWRPAGQGGYAIEMAGATFKWPEPKAEDEKKKGKKGGKKPSPAVTRRNNGAASSSATSGTQPLVAGQPSSSDAPPPGEDKPVLPPTLVDLQLRIPQGSLVGIAGPVGAGKSSLLSAFVGDIPRLGGRVVTRGSFSICTQEPWIQNCSLRENVLFGSTYDAAYYQRVLTACALEPDLATLPAGDQTEIGERGVTLSGGQKARVALARACYARANVVLLDDVISAVDAETGAHLMSQCVTGLLREAGATVLFVTHHTHHMVDCDHVVQLAENGTIKAQGKPSTIEGLIAPRNGNSSKNASSVDLAQMAPAADAGPPAAADGKAKAKSSGGGRDASKAKMMSDEERERGAVQAGVWWRYTAALGCANVCFGLVGMYGLSQALQFGSSYWMGLAAQEPDKIWFYLGVYCGLICVSAVCILFRSVVTALCSVAAGRKIHNRALRAVFSSPMAFFDTTPLGRILNRFSTDVQKVDVQLASSGSQFVGYIMTLLYTILMIALVSPFVLIALPPLTFFYILFASYYRNTAREVQRLDSISKSPIYAAFGEALNGATSIQAYGANERFEGVNRARVDFNLRANYVSLAANRWLTVRLEFFSNLLVALTAVLAVCTSIFGPTSAASAATLANKAGLALTYAPGLTDTLNFLIRQFTTLETMMVSVERLLSYAGLKGERTGSTLSVPPEWPHAGAIELRDMRMGYREGLPDVLKGCALSVRGGEKIGIVGRTGSGKSSLLVALFRICELRGGSLLIDGVDIANVDLPTLRSRLAIIPQDPVLFTGTLRSNIDPSKAATDSELWSVLQKCGIDGAMAEHPLGLDRPIEEKGGNLSMGQRQLLCLCRALLKRSRVLVLDEATASVDMESDVLIQRTLQHELGDTTVLTIAHRLDTIMHCDRVIVMSDGIVAEAGPPEELRQTKGGRFAELWDARTEQ